MQPPIGEAIPAAGAAPRQGTTRRIGRDARDTVFGEQCLALACEPARMARLAGEQSRNVRTRRT